jgi:fermentation-respiration switch protein FrsA (DUF1100 family)
MDLVEQLVFFPDRVVAAPPTGVEELWITTEDGVRLHAWYAPVPEPIATLVWSHGNGGNIAGRAEVLLALRRRGLAVLAYDYRGYGRSEGRPTEAGVYLDARAAYETVRAGGVDPRTILLFGESLGGAVSIHLAGERSSAAVAVVSTFTSLAAVARRHYGALALLAGRRFDSLSRLPLVRVPMFVAHGDADEIVPFALGETLYAAASDPKHFFHAAGFGHNDIFAAPVLLDAIADFARFAVDRAAT